MRLLIITNFFLPGIKGGGPIKSLANLTEFLSDDFDIGVITKSKDFGESDNYKNIEVNKWIASKYYKVKYLEHMDPKNIYKSIIEFNPDVIYINSLFASSSISVYILLRRLKNIKIILAPRGELNPNALSIKSFKKNIFIKLIKCINLQKKVLFHATSVDEKNDIKNIFKNSNIVVIKNLPSKINRELSSINKIHNELRIISISRISKMKNIHYLLNLLTKIKSGKVTLDIYGPIEDIDYYEKCLSIIKNMRPNVTINFMGEIENKLVQVKLKEYDLFVSPTLGENFGHTIIESLQSHTPVLISNNTPWKDLESQNVGYDISLNNPDQFIEVINKLILMDSEDYKKSFFGFENFLEKSLNINETVYKYTKLFKENINE
ncbi:glycosyltransferase family 4 protein [Macrococcoides canis]|uniref:glycosyltransferase family 4 protein n=1 Tax=Macrococcoides canis TaxID=1855823 RepID=UPI0010FBFDBB|nr:glycosyltransferase family 4 protein [Macrococcus canis]QCT74503.1 glycosyltransferase [Macrococcus canis]